MFSDNYLLRDVRETSIQCLWYLLPDKSIFFLGAGQERQTVGVIFDSDHRDLSSRMSHSTVDLRRRDPSDSVECQYKYLSFVGDRLNLGLSRL